MEACCFHNYECVDLPLTDCLIAGGLPMGEGTNCAHQTPTNPGGITDCRYRGCCWRQYPYDPFVCDDVPQAQCDELAGQTLGRGLLCRHIEAGGGCDWVGQIQLNCCLLDGSRTLLPASYCAAVRGVIVNPGEPCPPRPVDEQCREPQPDQHVDAAWTLELCATVPLAPRIAANHERERDGYGLLVSARGVRNAPDRTCELASTPVVLDHQNYGGPLFCSRQDRFGPAWHGHETVLVLQPEAGPRFTRPGYGLHMAAYDAPDWAEVTLGSILMRCWGPYH